MPTIVWHREYLARIVQDVTTEVTQAQLDAYYKEDDGATELDSYVCSTPKEAWTERVEMLGTGDELGYGLQSIVGNGRGITLTREQLESWAGRPLTDEEVEELDDAIPNASIPEAISTILDNL